MFDYESGCIVDFPNMTVTHPGLPVIFGLVLIVVMVALVAWAILRPHPGMMNKSGLSFMDFPVIGKSSKKLLTSPVPLVALKLLMVGFFLMMIMAGLLGTPLPERNLATVFTWNLWWSGLVFSVFFLGTSWCAICPWDSLAQWLVKRRLWGKGDASVSLNLRVPKWLQSVWPALFLFVILTWLELGAGITINPYATAIVALLMVLMSTVSLALFKRKAFCRYLCPVGRTVGFYSQLSMVELRPINTDTCANCKTLECYHGTDKVEPCPTSLVMGRLTQNSYCTSCGNCSQSCPEENVAWRLRSPSIEAIQSGRPKWDEAWFMIGLLSLTGFHGLTMLSFWEDWMFNLAGFIGDSGSLLLSFTLGLLGTMFAVAALYSATIWLTGKIASNPLPFSRLFSTFAFVALPLAFSYHMAHNLNHLVREGVGSGLVLKNPLGINTQPMSNIEKYFRHTDMWISVDWLFVLQVLVMIFGFWIAIQIIRYRGQSIVFNKSDQAAIRSVTGLLPIIIFVILITGFHLWMLMQPMTMRM